MTALGTLVAASPLNINDGVRYSAFTTNPDVTETATFALGDTPVDFFNMNSLSWTYDGRENINGGDDSEEVLVRIVNGGTIFGRRYCGGTFQRIYIKAVGGFSTTDVTRGPTAFTYVNTVANKATWDGATVEIRRINIKNKGPDGARPEPDYFAVTGDYTTSGLVGQWASLLTPYHCGPFHIASDNDRYLVANEDAINANDRIRIWKQTAGTGDYAIVATSGATYDSAASLTAIESGAKLLIVGHDQTLERHMYWVFDTATDAFTIDGETIWTDVTNINPEDFGIVVFSDGVVGLLANKDGATFRDAVFFTRPNIDAGASWSTGTVIIADTDYDDPQLFLDPDDGTLAHALGGDTTGNYWYRQVKSDETMGTIDIFTRTGIQRGSGRGMGGWYDDFEDVIHTPYRYDNGTTYSIGMFRVDPPGPTGTITDDGLQISDILHDEGDDFGPLTFRRVGGRMFVIFVRASDDRLVYSEYDAVLDTWSARTIWPNSPTATAGGFGDGSILAGGHVDGSGDVILYCAWKPNAGNGSRNDWEIQDDINLGPEYTGPTGTTFTESMAGAITPTGTPSPFTIGKALAGSLTSAGALTRAVSSLLEGTLSLAGAVTRSVTQTLAGSVTPTGLLAQAFFFTRAFAGSVTPTSVLTREPAINVEGDVTPSGARTATTGHLEAGTVGPTGTLLRRTINRLSGAVTPSGALATAFLFARSFAGAITPSGDTLRSVGKALAGSASSSGQLVKRISSTTAGTLTTAGTVIKTIASTLAGSVTPSATVTTQVIVGTFQIALAGTLSTAGSLARRISLSYAGAITPTGSLTRQISARLEGTLTTAGSLIRLTSARLEGALTSAGAVTTQVITNLFQIALSGTLTTAGALTKRITSSLAGTVTSAGALTKSVANQLEGTVTSAGTLTRVARVALAGTVTSAGTVANQILAGLVQIALSGTLTVAGQVDRLVSIVRGGTITPAGDTTKSSTQTIAGAVTPTGDERNLIAKLYTGALTTVGQLTRGVQSVLSGQITPTGTRGPNTIFTALSGALTPTGQMVKKRFLELGGTLTTSGTVATRSFRIVANAIAARVRGQARDAGTIAHQGRSSGIIDTHTNRETP